MKMQQLDPGTQPLGGTEAQPPLSNQDVSLLPEAMQYAQTILTEYDALLSQSPQTPAAEVHSCEHCNFQTTIDMGLRIHVVKTHTETIGRYVPKSFLSEHSKDGLPTCAACEKVFALWKGLKDHLLSGACSRPDILRHIDAQHSERQIALSSGTPSPMDQGAGQRHADVPALWQ